GLPSAHGATYPVNTCVSTKQKLAGSYCKSVLKAWAKWEMTQDTAARDASFTTAGTKLTTKWNQADTKALAKGTNCADTTLSSSAASAQIDSATAAIVGEVNDGLDLGQKDDAGCGAKLLGAAASKCAAFLKAESKYIKSLAKDPQGAIRDAAQAKASAKFGVKFANEVTDGCPTTATATEIENMVDAISDDIVRDTTISPNVDDSQYTTISPTGSTEYLGKTLTPKCVFDTPYSFFVKRGPVNKLLMYYQGGGACWEQITCAVPVCDDSVVTSGSGSDNPNDASTGFFDQNNPNNPFKDWNVVFVSYCSCDVHFGDAAQDYTNQNPNNPIHAEHRGFHNSRIAEKWAREHFVNPDQIFVTGSSAGAYGAWFNAPLLHETWPASHFQVLADAGNGVITSEFLQDFFPNWNFLGNIPKELSEIADIINTGGGIPEYTEFVSDRFPDTRWAHYTTAYDGGTGGQTGFYNIMLNNNSVSAALSWWEGSCAFNEQMHLQATDTYAATSAVGKPDNYRYYIGTGSRHTMWYNNKVYTDTTGGVPLLVDWVNGMLDGTNAWTNVECTDCGLLLTGDPKPNPLQDPFQQVGPDVKVVCSPNGAFLDGDALD
ncbi:MAG TPA: pectin acetylesterase-family hydrolase, partial [Candidatus Binatia bacterium]|nr:pectin acetylesterase-family hydrolase [Candidatus Binatia bacterium]